MHMQWAVARLKKKPTSKHRITHIHPDGHQPTNNHATEPNIQYTVAANNHQPIALPRNRIQHPKKTVNTHPTIRRCSKMLHALTNAIKPKNEPKHDTRYGCINHWPGNNTQQTTGRTCFRWQNTTILQQPTQLLKHKRIKHNYMHQPVLWQCNFPPATTTMHLSSSLTLFIRTDSS